MLRADVQSLKRLFKSKPEAAQAKLEASQEKLKARQALAPKIEIPPELPIAAKADEIAAALKAHQVVVVAGETGSGKTTQLPKICLQAGYGYRGLIGHTQPRRIAARAVATRIAEELEVPVGEQVGYSVRFADHVGPNSLIKIMTDGMLLAEIPRDRWLNRYDVIIVDEAHERSLNIDFLLGYLRELLDRRPDLKLIITSATIDVEAFSKHFKDAPIVQVSGRGYPVAVEYRDPAEADMSSVEGVTQALDDIANKRDAASARDALVFLPGEREIVDLAQHLRRNLKSTWEVLPLYARLPTGEQQRIFKSGSQRRVILATNVAETSLTVPNIGYVIDTGTARVSRYSYRSKLQRLPIEPISQASAAQRAGRCGRLGPGRCIRLFGEADFVSRPEFTDAEIQRTNLASVVLQMQAFGLGDIDRFPFLDPPEPAAVRAAIRLLEELGALERNKVTTLGRNMARLPIDPRLARVLLEASQQGALSELLIIASGLASIDPRERPRDKQAAADVAHEQFGNPKSEFLSWIALWRWADELRENKTRRRYERALHQAFVSPNRMREWRALHRQLLLAIRQMDLRLNETPADFASIHLSLLSGSLSFIGLHDERGQYLGARGLRFRIFPGSTLSSSKPKWLMAGEIVETSAVYARNIAHIDPRWVETQAHHLLKRDYTEPHWSAKRGEAMAYEKVSLYGLVLTERRRVSYQSIDPVICRELFLRDGLVLGQLSDRARKQMGFLLHNEEIKQSLLQQEAKARRRDLLLGEDDQLLLYASVVPNEINNLRALERWLRRDPHNDGRLRFSEAQLRARSSPDLVDYPPTLSLGDHEFDVQYRFAPGEADDGVTLLVPLGQLTALVAEPLAWSVPGMLPLLVEQWLRSLPKQIRKHLAPLPDKLPALLDRLLSRSNYRQGRLHTALAQVVADLYEVTINPKDWVEAGIEAHLNMNIKVLDEVGKVLTQDRDLVALQERFHAQVAAQVAAGVEDDYELTGLQAFPEDREVPLRKTLSSSVLAYPGLQDLQGEAGRDISAKAAATDGVKLALFATAVEAQRANRRGYPRLAMLQSKPTVRKLRSELIANKALGLHYAPLGNLDQLLDDMLLGVAWHTLFEASQDSGEALPSNAEDFAKRLSTRHGLWTQNFRTTMALVAQILKARFELVSLLDKMTSPAFTQAVADAKAQLHSLVPASLVQSTPSLYLQQVPRYLQALKYRLENLQGRVARDDEQLQVIRGFEARLAKLAGVAAISTEQLDRLNFDIQELRVALFAERLKQGKISPKRLQQGFLAVEQEFGLA